MVSIIVPIYNVEQYISKCIESILAQTYRDFELILVDDGSPDNCGKICDEYAKQDSRVHVIHQENKGVSAARNAGISLAKGEYISFIDGDDYVEKDFFERIITQFTDEVDCVCFGYNSVDDDDNELGTLRYQTECFKLNTEKERCEFIANKLLQHRITWEVTNKIFRRDVIENNKLRFLGNREIIAEDQLFCTYYCLYAKCILCTDDTPYNYVVHQGSIMANRNGKSYLKQIAYMTEQLFLHLSSNGCSWALQYFPLFHYLIVRNEIQLIQKDQNIDIRNIRNKILLEVANQEFFFEQLKKMKLYKNHLFKLWGENSARIELSAIRFLINGKYTAMRIRNKLIRICR